VAIYEPSHSMCGGGQPVNAFDKLTMLLYKYHCRQFGSLMRATFFCVNSKFMKKIF
jgi:hypothetical protein